MLEAFSTHLCSLHRKTKTFLQQLKSTNNRLTRRGRRHKGLMSPDMLSSFAAMEVRSQFKQVFKAMDANGDGAISPLELSEVLLCLGYYDRSKAIQEAHGMVREMDCNGDGVIDFDEFMGVVSDDGKEDHLLDAFLIFDSDNNGLISARELQHVLTNLGGAKCSIQECKRMIQAFDTNGDGFVDFTEFRSMMTM